MVKINNNKLCNKSPEAISIFCKCSYSTAIEALHFLRYRYTAYLHQPFTIPTKGEFQETELIEVIENQDVSDYSLKEFSHDFNETEKLVVELFIGGYRRENIIEYTHIQPKKLKSIIDSILDKAGVDSDTILNRNEEMLMTMASLHSDLQTLTGDVIDENFLWIDIDMVTPSPYNPRKDLTINSQGMMSTLNDKDWEEPITCYKRNSYYCILSGHRRWAAAKERGDRQLPIFIVPRPKDQAEELDRLGSLQSGQVEWTPYEVAKNTHDRWLYSGGISYSDLAKKIGTTKSRVTAKITVYRYYPKVEIANKLANGMYSISMLYNIAQWIKRLAAHHPLFVHELTEEYIRQQMLKKYENKCFNSQLINDKTFVTNATEEQLLAFINDRNKSLKQSQIEVIISKSSSLFSSSEVNQLVNVSGVTLRSLIWNDEKDARRLLDELTQLMQLIDEKTRLFMGEVKE